MPRMTNTYMLNGDKDPQEIIKSVKKGLYAANFGGGQVDITSGKFVFSAAEAYMIEDGKITYPVKGATLIGNGPDVLTKVSMIGNDMALDSGVGTCGKEGQSVPVGVGQPRLRRARPCSSAATSSRTLRAATVASDTNQIAGGVRTRLLGQRPAPTANSHARNRRITSACARERGEVNRSAPGEASEYRE